MRSAVPIQSTGHVAGFGTGLPSSATTLKRVARQSEAANFGGAAVQNMKKNSFAVLYPNRFAVAEHASIDGERAVADFISVRHAFGERRFHRGFAASFE